MDTIKDDEDKMKKIAIQAHEQCFNASPKITFANATIKELFFPDNFNNKPIKLDVLLYTAEGRYRDKEKNIPYHLHLTKGLRPDCVYYLIPHLVNNTKILSLLPDHMCNLTMP